jgi:hypothetical protein
MNLMGRCCEEGWGCPEDAEGALYWYGRSAQGGYFRGQYNYATCLAERGFEAEARTWFSTAMAGGLDLPLSLQAILRDK